MSNGNGNNWLARMNKPKLNGWLIKAVIGLVAFVFGAGVAWGLVNGRLNDVCSTVEDHETRIRKVEGTVIEANGRLGNIEASQTKAEKRFDAMGLDIISIKLDLIEIKNAVK
jgi:hypothetical protein